MILKPYRLSPDNIAQDATEDIVVSWVNQGDRQYSYKVDIYDITNNDLIHTSNKVTSIETFYLIPKNTLINGVTYKYQVTVWNQIDESAISSWINFKCSSIPICSMSNLEPGSIIRNNSFLFQGEYIQNEDVPIMYWKMILYDNSNEKISETDSIFSDVIEYTFSGFLNQHVYSIELQVTSQDGLSGTTDKIPFTSEYETPPLTIALEAENTDMGSVKLMWNMLQIIGESENASFIEDEKLDVTDGKVVFDNGFSIEGNFTLKLWIESVTNVDFHTNPNSSIILSSVEPTSTDVVWFENNSQSEETIINTVVSRYSLVDTNNIWIENQDQSTERLLDRVSKDIIEPTYLNTFWVDLFPKNSLDNIEILKMQNDLNEVISLIYCNNMFYIFKNEICQDNIGITGDKFFLYIQQIGSRLHLHVENI